MNDGRLRMLNFFYPRSTRDNFATLMNVVRPRPWSLVLLLLLALPLWGQRPAGNGAGTMGRVYGRVLDAQTRKAAEYATVTVLAMRNDSLLGGTIVRPNGDFDVEKLPMGRLRVQISFIGYRTLSLETQLSREKPEHDLGNLLLEPDAELLKEVEVVGERATMVMQVDRRVFNVEKDLSTQGGTGVEVMKNVPGLSVDVDGNVEMRGSRPLILVDGRPTSMQLDQIPAEDIERVEVITNPSVAFDASTTGGIINVVLKKNTKPGYYGQVQAGAGTNDRYQGSISLNAKEGRVSYNLSYNYNTGRNLTDGETRRTDLLNGGVLGRFAQETESSSGRTMHGGRIGLEWQQSNRNTFGISFNGRKRSMDSEDVQAFTSEDGTGELLRYGSQVNTSLSENFSYTGQLTFRRKAPKEGKEWSADLTYNGWQRESDGSFNLSSVEAVGGSSPGSPSTQRNVGGSNAGTTTFQLDVVDPLSERTKIEYGVRSNVTLDNTWLDVFITRPEESAIRDSTLSNNYDITDIINAAYFNWSRKLDAHWSVMAGLRFEQTWYETLLKDTDQRFSYKYPDGTENLAKALFPAVYLVRRWEGSTRELQVNFSRKIDRPRFWQIMPFIMFADSRNVRIGNPTLAPELSNLAEVNHLLPFLKGKASWRTAVYGRYTQDVITGYASPLPSDSLVLLNTFVNGSYSTSGGWENVFKFDPAKGLQFTLSGTVQYTDIALSNTQGGDRNQGFNWNAKALASYRFGRERTWALQVNSEYEGPRIQPQGRTLAQYGVDVSVNREFSKQWSANLNVNDVFYTRRWGNILDTPNVYQENFRRREQRFIRLTLTWKFGERDATIFKRRQQPREPGGRDGDMEM